MGLLELRCRDLLRPTTRYLCENNQTPHALASWSLNFSLGQQPLIIPIQIVEAHAGGCETQIDCPRWTIPLLGNNQLRHILLIFGQTVALFLSLVLLLAIDKRHYVRVLLQCSRLTQVSQLRAVVRTRLRRAREL